MCIERHSTVVALALASFAFSAGASAQLRFARMPEPVVGPSFAGSSLAGSPIPGGATSSLAGRPTAPDLVVRVPFVNPARVPSIAPITLGIPTISEPGPPTFDACPNDRGALGVPGVGCGRWTWR